MKIIQEIGDMNRFREILTALSDVGLLFLAKKLKLKHYLSPTCRICCFFSGMKSCSEDEIPKRLRLLLEKLGPTFIKIGQILSVRPDFIPKEYIEELKQLQDKVPEFSYKEVEEIIQNELKKPVSQIFESIDKKPIAAASLAQVHKAILKSGQKVAVKVQRPNIQKIIERDLRIIKFFAERLEKYIPETRNFRPIEAAKEFERYTLNELDFIIEGKNADRFRYNFKDDKGIKIPKIYWDYSTSHILTMEFIEGVKIGDLEGMKKMGINHMVLANNCTRACIEPILFHGFFHADPHPGNIWVLKDNTVCYLDFGMVGIITKDMRKNMLLHFKAITDKEVELALKYLLKLAITDSQSDITGFKTEAENYLISLYIDSTKRETFAKTFYKIVSSAAKHGIIFPSNTILMAKALMTGETMCRITHKDFDIIESSKETIQKIYLQNFGPKKIMNSFIENLPTLVEFAERFPEIGLNLLQKIEKGELNVNLNIKDGGKIKLTK